MDFHRPLSDNDQDADSQSCSSFQSTVSVLQDDNTPEGKHSTAENAVSKLTEGSKGQIISSDDDDSYFTDAEMGTSEKINSINNEEEEKSSTIFSYQEDKLGDLPHPGFIPVIFGCLSQTSQPRSLFLRIITHRWFERISMLVIILNCITLGMYRPCYDEKCDDERCQALKVIDHIIFIFFLVEMLMKIVSMGFVGKGAYLAESWNRLDMFIVFAGILEYCLDFLDISLSAIRTIRVMRPLRAVNRIPSMRILVMLILDTLPMLGNVLMLCAFVFLIFGIVGVQLWSGMLRQRCFLPDDFSLPENFSLSRFYVTEDMGSDYICSMAKDSGMHKCDSLPYTKSDDGLLCTGNVTSMFLDNLNNSCINWNQYYTECRAGDKNPFQGAISFDHVGLAFIAVYQVITMSAWAGILNYLMDAHSVWVVIYFVVLIVIGSFFMLNLCLVVITGQFVETKEREKQKMKMERALSSSMSTLNSTATTVDSKTFYQQIIGYFAHVYRRSKRRLVRRHKAYRARKEAKRLSGDKMMERDKSAVFSVNDQELTAQDINTPPKSARCQTPKRWLSFQRRIYTLVNHNHFQNAMLVAIMINTLSMAIEHHNQPQELTLFVEYTNMIFSIVFAIEMILKIIGEGRKYLNDPLNIFDAIIVVLSLVEMFKKLISNSGENSSLSVMRTFRLLRLVKVVRFMPNLRRQLAAMMRTIGNLSVFLLLFNLFVFIFSVLGMYLFGGKFCMREDGSGSCSCSEIIQAESTCVCDRKNFDSMLWAFVTVFQILTQESWHDVLYNGMEKTSQWAAIYFILLMSFGNYVLFNLLVAILVDGVGEQGEEEQQETIATYGTITILSIEASYSTELQQRQPFNDDVHTFDSSDPKKFKVAFLNDQLQTKTHPELNNESKQTNCELSCSHYDPKSNIERENLILSQSPTLLCTRAVTIPTDSHCLICSVLPGSIVPSSQINLCAETSSDSMSSISSSTSESNTSQSQDQEVEDKITSEAENIAGAKLNNENSERVSDANLHLLLTNNHQRKSILSHQNSLGNPTKLSPVDTIISAPIASNVNITESSVDNNNANTNDRKKKLCDRFYERFPCAKKREDYAFFVVPPNNTIRKCITTIVTNNWFDHVILVFIVFNCITLAMERPAIQPDSMERQFLTYSGYMFTAIFAFEMCLKLFCFGLFLGEDAYLKSGWNILDSVLVLISFIDLILTFAPKSSGGGGDIGILRIFRLLRALRPLRVINRAPNLKLVVETLMSSMRPLGTTLIICFAFFVIFAILGVQLFKGSFYYCDGPNIRNVKNKTDCLAADPKNEWVNQIYNFDDLLQALLTLFVFSNKDGWLDILYSGIDAVGVDQQPIKNYAEWRLIYFLPFLLLVGFFVLNMFIGVVVENFQKCQEQQRKEREALKLARKSSEEVKKQKEEPIILPIHCPRRMFLYKILTSTKFDIAIAVVISLNVITMAIEFYQMPTELEFALEIFNFIFTIVFTVEFIVKIVAFGPRLYFKDHWNKLDVVIVILSYVGILLEELGSGLVSLNPTIIRVMRMLRVARLLKLIKNAQGIRSLLETVMKALPQVGNLGLLFMLLFFMFSALGVELFGRIECSDDHPCEGIDEHSNFSNFGMTFLTLFRVATGDWNGIMKDTMRPDCDSSSDCIKNCCILYFVPPIYFVIFVLLSQLVLINVVVAVLMQNLEDTKEKMKEEQAERSEHESNGDGAS